MEHEQPKVERRLLTFLCTTFFHDRWGRESFAGHRTRQPPSITPCRAIVDKGHTRTCTHAHIHRRMRMKDSHVINRVGYSVGRLVIPLPLQNVRVYALCACVSNAMHPAPYQRGTRCIRCDSYRWPSSRHCRPVIASLCRPLQIRHGAVAAAVAATRSIDTASIIALPKLSTAVKGLPAPLYEQVPNRMNFEHVYSPNPI